MENFRNQSWFPERIFYSHATNDKKITSRVGDAIKRLNNQYEIFISEHKMSGTPLLTELKEEILNSNGILVAWTEACCHQKTSEIISFEVGMAYSLGMPIFLLQFDKIEMPWFFSQVTKYAELETRNLDYIDTQLSNLINTNSFLHPVDIIFEKKPHPKKISGFSKNEEVVQEDGSFRIPDGFSGILHYWLIPRRTKPEKSVRITITFPPNYSLEFNPGSLDFGKDRVLRTDLFYFFWHSRNVVTLHWPSLPPVERYFEIKINHLKKTDDQQEVTIQYSSESLATVRKKIIPIVSTR